jgi:SAM-dependent methyltransferase
MYSTEWNPYYVRRRPPQGDANERPFEESYWGTVTDPDGLTRDLLSERERRIEDVKEELAYIHSLPAGRILDVGCGLGYLLSAVDGGWEKHGLELSEFAAKRAAEHGKIHVGDLRSAAYPDEHFDVIVLYHVIEHMYQPVEELEEIFRVLKPNGSLIIGTPNFDSACARRFGEKYRLLHDATHITLFSRESLDRFLWDHGFFVDRVEFPYFETRYFTTENFERLKDTNAVSPPFYGNIMTFYCRKPVRSELLGGMAMASRLAHRVSVEQADQLEQAAALLAQLVLTQGSLWTFGESAPELASRFAVSGFRVKTCADANSLPADFGPTDLLFVTACDVVPLELMRAARQRDGHTIALVGRRTSVNEKATVVRIPSVDPSHLEYVQQFITTMLCATLPSFDDALLDAAASAAE